MQQPESPDCGFVALFEAIVRRTLNQYTQAEALLRQALTVFQTHRRQTEVARTLLELGQLLIRQSTQEALQTGHTYLAEAETILQTLNFPLLSAWVQLERAETLFRLGRISETTALAQSAGVCFAQAGLTLRHTQAQLLETDCMWRLVPRQAQKTYEEALQLVGELPPLALRCWHGLGRLAAITGDTRQAEVAYQHALEQLELGRHILCDYSQRAQFLEDKQPLLKLRYKNLH